jgi:hypothetical protein
MWANTQQQENTKRKETDVSQNEMPNFPHTLLGEQGERI